MKTIVLLALACAFAVPSHAQQTSTESTSQVAAPSTASPKNWLIGRWEFDHDFTKSKQGGSKRDEAAANTANAVIASQMLEKMKGATLAVTDSEIVMTRGDGTGKFDRYTLITFSDPNVLQLKQENGETVSFHRDGDRVWTNSSGSVNDPLYFRRAK